MKNADYYEAEARRFVDVDGGVAIAQVYATLAVAAALADLPITAKRIDIGIGTVTTAIENLEQAVRR